MFWSKHLCPSCHPTSSTIYLSFPNFIQTIELFNVHIAYKICLTSILFHPTFQCSHFIICKIKSRKSRKSSTRPLGAPQARCLNRCLAMGSMKSSVAGARSMTWLGEMVRSWVQDTGATHEDDDDGLCVRGGGGSIAMSLNVPDLSRFSSSDVTHFLSYVYRQCRCHAITRNVCNIFRSLVWIYTHRITYSIM